MHHFCGATKLGPDYTFIHCLRIYLLLVSPVTHQLIVFEEVYITNEDKVVVYQDMVMEIGSAKTEIASSVAVEGVATFNIDLIETKKRQNLSGLTQLDKMVIQFDADVVNPFII